MSEDDFTEVSSESWFGRISGAIKGIVVGLIFFVASFPLLFWNEGRSVKTFKTLKEGGKTVISVPADRVDPANSNKLVHVTGKAITDAKLNDPVFGVTVQALKLNRSVEMFQWKESSEQKSDKKVGGSVQTTTTYSYSKVWSDKPINSSGFKNSTDHQNPGSMPYESAEWVAESVTLGAYKLSASLIRKINNPAPLPIPADAPMPAAILGKGKAHNAGYYIGRDPASPMIGDMRVSFKVTNPTEVSVIAKQVENTFEPFQAKAGGTIELLQMGIKTSDTMIETAQQENVVMTWILRLIGFMLMFAGLNMLFKPLSVIADVLPILGDIVGAGTGIISFLIAGILSLITIAVAWIVYRPLLAILLIAAAGGLTYLFVGKVRKAKANKMMQAP